MKCEHTNGTKVDRSTILCSNPPRYPLACVDCGVSDGEFTKEQFDGTYTVEELLKQGWVIDDHLDSSTKPFPKTGPTCSVWVTTSGPKYALPQKQKDGRNTPPQTKEDWKKVEASAYSDGEIIVKVEGEIVAHRPPQTNESEKSDE